MKLKLKDGQVAEKKVWVTWELENGSFAQGKITRKRKSEDGLADCLEKKRKDTTFIVRGRSPVSQWEDVFLFRTLGGS